MNQYFSPELFYVNSSYQNKDEILHTISQQLTQLGYSTDRDLAFQSLQARENLSSTIVADDIAIPHTKHSCIQHPSITFIRLQEPIIWDTNTKQTVHLIFVLAIPDNNLYLDAISYISSILSDTSLLQQLNSLTSFQEFTKLFQTKTVSHQENTTTTDIVAITSCPTGIALTYLAADSLQKIAQEKQYHIKIQTNGAVGTQNPLSDQEIINAKALIIATDVYLDIDHYVTLNPNIIITTAGYTVNHSEEVLACL